MELLKKENNFQIQTKGYEVVKDESGKIQSVILEGYASTKHKDRVNDVVLPSAFEKALDLYMKNARVFLQHDANKNVGETIEATINSKGLFVKTEISLNISLDGTDEVRLFDALEKGLYKTYSIGYRVNEVEEKEVKQDGKVVGYERIIKDLDLMEISLVSVPANPYALIKSINDCLPENTKLDKEVGIEQLKEMTGDAEVVKNEDIEEKEEIEEKTGEDETIEEEKDVVVGKTIEDETDEVKSEDTDGEEPKEDKTDPKEVKNQDLSSQDTGNSDESSENGDEKGSVVEGIKEITSEVKNYDSKLAVLEKKFEASVKEVETKYESKFESTTKEVSELKTDVKDIEESYLDLIKEFKALTTYTKQLEDQMSKVVVKKGYTYETLPKKEKSVYGRALGI